MRRLSLDQANELRRTPGATVVLYLTDRCPVGCAHCSVASRVDSATISDWDRFTAVVDGVCALPAVQAVAITGGDPFAERRGLRHAVCRLSEAGKAVVLFTSGFWARAGTPTWVEPILRLTSTVFLSTDSFHAAALGSPALLGNAVKAITAAGCHLVLQVLDEPQALAAARALCPTADISVVPPLSMGRGRTQFDAGPLRPVEGIGRCTLLGSPTVRYDGWVSACCNEEVVTGAGPAALRRRAATARDVAAALDSFRADPVLRLVGAYGPVALQTVAPGPFRSVCQSCWAGHERVATDAKALATVSVLCGAT